jgi:hypothetical protein
VQQHCCRSLISHHFMSCVKQGWNVGSTSGTTRFTGESAWDAGSAANAGCS